MGEKMMLSMLILWNLTYLIDGQQDIVVNFVDDASAYCGVAVVSCADIKNRVAYIEPWWGPAEKLIAHEVTHIATGWGDTDEFRAKVDELNQCYGEQCGFEKPAWSYLTG